MYAVCGLRTHCFGTDQRRHPCRARHKQGAITRAAHAVAHAVGEALLPLQAHRRLRHASAAHCMGHQLQDEPYASMLSMILRRVASEIVVVSAAGDCWGQPTTQMSAPDPRSRWAAQRRPAKAVVPRAAMPATVASGKTTPAHEVSAFAWPSSVDDVSHTLHTQACSPLPPLGAWFALGKG